MRQVSRYHPLLVTLHWVLAVLIIAELSLGFFWLAVMPDTDPQKIGILRVHMLGGVLILALMAIRFIVRVRTSRPVDATTGYPPLDRVAPITHYGFYALVLVMVGAGFAAAIGVGLGQIVFGPQAPGYRRPWRFIRPGWRTAILPCSSSDSSFCTCWRRSTTNSSEKTDCSAGYLLGDACHILPPWRNNSAGK